MVPRDCQVRRCTLARNSAMRGGALYLVNSPVISQCVFVANSADRGGAIYALHSGQVTGCTIAFNVAPLGGGLWLLPSVLVEQTIIAFNGPGEAIGCESSQIPELSCSNVYGNAGGDWVGCISSQAGTKGNLAADPLFCEQLEGNLHLCENSPCAPGQTGACGLIGALDVDCPACGTTAVESTTWGSIKARLGSFR
jgi:predicted outer membrane repeat protein